MRFKFTGPEQLTLADIMSNPATALLEIATPEAVTYPDDAISFAVEQYAVAGQQRREDVRAVAGELLANAALHGNEQDSTKRIWTYCLWHSGFYVAVRDEGAGFDINNPPFVPGRSGMPPEGGLGLRYAQRRSDLLYAGGSTVVGWFKE